uniref:NADH-ubiquinone oxidoreductase chain 6 n=1 Tax=Arachnobas tricolor TaxID=1738226 RepID=A0A343C258_9CUCU|nr:NADH dehydrogenase subunit 6 [Arachnobas tricolor]
MLLLNWTFSMIFLFLNHPLSLGCILLTQAILIALASGYMFFNFWFSYILFLIMIGGMLVMFIYMTSIASNEKFKLPKFMTLFCLLMFLTLSFMMILKDNFYTYMLNIQFLSSHPMNINFSMNLSLNKYFNYPGMFILISLMIYLLLTLIAIVKIIGKSSGTLRQK